MKERTFAVGTGLIAFAFIAVIVLFGWPPSERVSAQPTIIGPGNAILCNLGVQVTGTAALAQVLAAITGQRINICGWSFTNTAASGTFQVAYGTGANCGTGTTNLTPALSVGATAVTDHAGLAVLSTPLSQALCVNATATINGIVWVSQF